jgi:RNA polymerase sigma-70 factor (ECF subfamily)
MAIPAEVLEIDRKLLWGLCYRMTGNAADADDIVQETFVRAIENPPRRLDQPLRPWLVRVAMNLSRDYLRRRRRREYIGPWLPSPVPTDEADNPASYEPPAPTEHEPAARYEMLESISFAFLLALEALTPAARAVLLLRDVFDYSTAETAEALDMTEASVKVTLHRARQRMREYDKERHQSSARQSEETHRALEQFLLYMSTRDVEGMERLLTEEVVDLSDGGGQVAAAMQPIRGRDKVMRLIFGLASKFKTLPRFTFRLLNGKPALLIEGDYNHPRIASRFTLHVEVDPAGRIKQLSFVLAPDKLSAL